MLQILQHPPHRFITAHLGDMKLKEVFEKIGVEADMNSRCRVNVSDAAAKITETMIDSHPNLRSEPLRNRVAGVWP
jgi:hypothetical protein